MRSEALVWTVAALTTAMLAVLVGFGASGVAVVFFAIVGGLLVTVIGWAMRRPADATWLPRWVAIGFAVKMAGTVARWYMVTAIYGLGDSYRYYRAGTELAAQWREGHIPDLSQSGSLGTQVVEAVTGFLFALVTPDMLGGFLLFAILAYMGQLLLYAAFRRHARPHQLKIYAMAIFLLPTYSFWPSSIGKDALVLLALGLSAYVIARSLEGFEVRWLFILGLSLAGLGVIRIHIAGLVIAGFVAAALFAKASTGGDPAVFLRRLIVIGAGAAAAVAVLAVFPDVFGVDVLSTQDRDGFAAEVVRRTSESGTVAEGGAINSPLDIPAALGHVLFRPYPFEATELQHFLAAAETAAVAGFTLWRLPAIFRNLRRWRANPYVVFCSFYTLGFAVAFSVVRNLGIIARQRGQVLAFFLCFVITLGWEEKDDGPPGRISPQQPARPLSATTGTSPRSRP